ncbi:hypothetical protein JAAARDRAFT_625109 [Jaapia argillacea MUCL 33604]|uniref:DNA mismatch repair protein MSH3 n=1 Tax=Jaapia argillacea MUCL 33604 TaxID=933084 RepID=A0A067PXY1_9AGAM|nr:hypothetical protein JAAARDRAFT_625109 [Jaapia argillacea MUCL 33604]
MSKTNKGGLAQNQRMISSFFSQTPSPIKSQTASQTRKRPSGSTIIDLTSDGEPPKKKARVSRLTSSGAAAGVPSSTQDSPRAADKWRFVRSSQVDDSTGPQASQVQPQRTQAQQRVHEAFQKKLLGENNPFSQQRRSESVPVYGSEDGRDPDELDDDGVGDSEKEKPKDKGKGNKGKQKEVVDLVGGSDEDSDEAFKSVIGFFKNEQAKAKGKGKGKAALAKAASSLKKLPKEVGPSGETYTELELQVKQLQKDHPGTLLMVEVGYKYYFFGDDAKVAAKELGIVCYQHRNFLRASIPTHRREIHLKKLLAQGYKVGIVDQTETAALKKVGDTRNKLFGRGLSHLYTATTYVDSLDSPDIHERSSAPPLMCLVEELRGGMGADERVGFGMVVVCPSTGDVVWDEFDDMHMRTELETRMAHTKPSELLLPTSKLSKTSEKMLDYFTTSASEGQRIRVERYDDELSYTEAFDFLTEFYTDKKRTKDGRASESFKSGELLAAITAFPRNVVKALAYSIKYLSNFRLAEAFLETRYFGRFTSSACMVLGGNTLKNLEIYFNDTDYTIKGSLMWILNHTKTSFGARMFRNWVGRPLVDTKILKERFDAVEEIVENQNEKLVTLRNHLKEVPDLAKGLCRIQYGKCTPKELGILIQAFGRVASLFLPFSSPSAVGFKSLVLNEIFFALPKLIEPINSIKNVVDVKKATQGKKEEMWKDVEGKYPKLCEVQKLLDANTAEMDQQLKNLRKTLRMPSLEWTSNLGEEYLVQVPKSDNKPVPDNWVVVQSTKHTRRYRPPEVTKKMQARNQLVETRQAEADKAYLSFLEEIIQNHYGVLRDAVTKLATADCLLSLASVAVQPGYVRPKFTEDDTLEIVEGRHPMVEALRSDPFVPNSVKMGDGEPRSKIITGPNMGGKSSCVRMIALIAIMAQIGSYVPAKSVSMGMVDSILTRMGASDELAKGRSTFMVEMSETSDILEAATPKSLVILDELGRGTSTFDGMAVADAVLQHLVQTTKCKTLFITHYPLVATELERKFPRDLQNLHMGFTEESRIDGSREITFLYRLTLGIATESFGIECARLATIPENILQVARERSEAMRRLVEERAKRNKIRKWTGIIKACIEGNHDLQELRRITEASSEFNSDI